MDGSVELCAHRCVVAQRSHEKEVSVAVADVERGEGGTALQRVRHVGDTVHPLGEVRCLAKPLASHDIDQQFRRLINGCECGDRPAPDRLDEFLRCRNDQLAALDVVAPGDDATDAGDQHHEQCGDGYVKRYSPAAVTWGRPRRDGPAVDRVGM